MKEKRKPIIITPQVLYEFEGEYEKLVAMFPKSIDADAKTRIKMDGIKKILIKYIGPLFDELRDDHHVDLCTFSQWRRSATIIGKKIKTYEQFLDSEPEALWVEAHNHFGEGSTCSVANLRWLKKEKRYIHDNFYDDERDAFSIMAFLDKDFKEQFLSLYDYPIVDEMIHSEVEEELKTSYHEENIGDMLREVGALDMAGDIEDENLGKKVEEHYWDAVHQFENEGKIEFRFEGDGGNVWAYLTKKENDLILKTIKEKLREDGLIE